MIKTLSRYILAIIFIASGILHFVIPQSYLKVMPVWMPYPYALVLVSGLLELIGGGGLLVKSIRNRASWLIVALLVSFLLVHVEHIRNGGHVTKDLTLPIAAVWARLVMQGLFIVWARWVAH